MARWATRLYDNAKVPLDKCSALASEIGVEVKALSPESKAAIRKVSPVPVSARLDELRTFQMWMDLAIDASASPAVVRAQVITQNYVCFVYLKDALFDVLRREAPTGSVTKKTCKYLLNNPVRAFRNAMAHGNWTYSADFSGLDYWARKGSDPAEPMSHFQVSQDELSFWQALARCVAYVGFSHVS